MNCPNCGKEMETGGVYTHKYITWYTDAPPVFRVSKENIIRPRGDTSTGCFGLPGHSYPQCCRCRACGLILIPYQQNE